MQNLLVVIPARGGSRGIPRKAMVDVGGRPLLWYTLDYVQRLDLSSSAVVVTDDNEIDDYASAHGCHVVREPRISSQNENSVRAVYRAVVGMEQRGRLVDRVVILQPTHPVRPLDVVQLCLAAIHGLADASLTTHEPKVSPQLMAVPTDGLLKFTDYRKRQDFPHYYCANGQCYVFGRGVFSSEPESLSAFHGSVTYRGVPTPAFPYVDIDEPHDLVMFRLLLEGGYTLWSATPGATSASA
jgi:CMP-N,N'-diacetyllegionaminic acid synthase